MKRSFRLLTVLTSSVLALASCGGGESAGDNLGLLVLPSSVIIGPAAMSTCSDTVQGSITPSGTAPVILFPRFRLDWKHKTNSLLVSIFRITVQGVGVSGGKSVILLSGDEIKYLLGSQTIPPDKFVDISHRDEDPTTSPRGISRNLPPCNLVIPGVSLLGGDKTPSFRATVKIDVIGTSISPDFQDQQFVQQTVRASASYIKY